MRKILLVGTIFLVSFLAGSLSAQTSLTGDALIRPRLDIKDGGDYENSSTNGYYYYRARLNVNSKLGDGWFGQIQVGTVGYGYFTGIFGSTTASNPSAPSPASVNGGYRGPVDFMLINFGRKTEKFGYWGGLIPVNGIVNPALDIHYYSDQMIDVPFFLYSNNGAYGFAGYTTLGTTKLNATILVDNNDGINIELPDGTDSVDTKDQYTVMFDAPLEIGEATVQPIVLFTLADTDMPAPTTFGANLISPKIGNFTFFGTFVTSFQSEGDSTMQYSAWLARIKAVGKLGTGTLTAWLDIANKTWDDSNVEHDFTYLWLSYTIPVHNSKHGAVSIRPTWRHKQEKVDGVKDFSRDKIEVTLNFSFK